MYVYVATYEKSRNRYILAAFVIGVIFSEISNACIEIHLNHDVSSWQSDILSLRAFSTLDMNRVLIKKSLGLFQGTITRLKY